MVWRQSVQCVCSGDTGGERTDWRTDGQTRSASKPLQGPSVKIPSEMNLASENEAAAWCVCIWLCWCCYHALVTLFFFIYCLTSRVMWLALENQRVSLFGVWMMNPNRATEARLALWFFGDRLWTHHRLKTGGRGCHGDATQTHTATWVAVRQFANYSAGESVCATADINKNTRRLSRMIQMNCDSCKFKDQHFL